MRKLFTNILVGTLALFAPIAFAQKALESSGAVVGHVFYGQPGDTIASIAAECSSVCTYTVTTPQTITLGADTTLAGNVQLDFKAGGVWTLAGGHTLTIPGNVTGTLNQHFAGGTVVFGTAQAVVPVEWFGAVGDWNGSSGTNNTAAIQAAIDSLTAGNAALQAKAYMVSSAITLHHSNTGLIGVRSDIVYSSIRPNPLPSSVIVSTSASADIVDVFGNSQSDMLVSAILQDFTVKRTVTPTGTASGIYLNNTFAATVIRTASNDSIYDYHIHGSYQGGLGNIAYNLASNGVAGVSQAAAQYVGYFLDSLDGVANQTIVMYNNTQCCGPTSGASNIGILVKGSAINDLMVDTFQGTGSTRAIDIEYTGGGSLGSATDIHVVNTIADSCAIGSGSGSCVYIDNLPINASVDIDGGWFANASPVGPVVDIENSYGVTLRGAQLITGGSGPNMIGVKISGQSHNKVIDNTFLNLLGTGTTGVYIANSSINVISGNTFMAGTDSGLPIPEFIQLDANSYKNVVSGNVFDGWGNYAISNYYDIGSSSVGTASNAASEVKLGEMQVNTSGTSYAAPFSQTTVSSTGAIPYGLGSGLIESWAAQDGSGSTFVNTGTDSTNAMTASNVAWATATGFTSPVATYNGTNAAAIATSSASTNFDGSSPFSACSWATPSVTSGTDNWLLNAMDYLQTGFPGWGMEQSAGTGLQVYLRGSGGGSNFIDVNTSAVFAANTLTLACFTYDGTTTAAGVKLYKNGSLVTPNVVQDSLIGSIASGVPVASGCFNSSSGCVGAYFQGAMGHSHIWNRALSPTDIANVYALGVTAF